MNTNSLLKKKFEKDQKVMARSRLLGAVVNAKKETCSESNQDDDFTLLKNRHCGPLSSKLKAYEDDNLGNFSRIFPPQDEELLNSYLNLLLYLNSLSSSDKHETAATKARKEYLESKKSMQDLKVLKYQQWKNRRSISKPRSFSLDSVLQNKEIKPRISSTNRTVKSEMELRVHNITYPACY